MTAIPSFTQKLLESSDMVATCIEFLESKGYSVSPPKRHKYIEGYLNDIGKVSFVWLRHQVCVFVNERAIDTNGELVYCDSCNVTIGVIDEDTQCIVTKRKDTFDNAVYEQLSNYQYVTTLKDFHVGMKVAVE